MASLDMFPQPAIDYLIEKKGKPIDKEWFGQLHIQAPSGRIYRKLLPSITLTQSEELSASALREMLDEMVAAIMTDLTLHKDVTND